MAQISVKHFVVLEVLCSPTLLVHFESNLEAVSLPNSLTLPDLSFIAVVMHTTAVATKPQ